MNLNRIYSALLMASAFMLSACGPELTPSPSAVTDKPQTDYVPETRDWPMQKLASIQGSGLLKANISAHEENGILHLAYMAADTDTKKTNIHYAPWNLSNQSPYLATETVQAIDNSASLASALDPTGELAVAYQGGEVRECQENEQSDVMLAQRKQNWLEQTASIGFVERNPAFSDGLAGGTINMVIDDYGTRHIIYQFYYEGCDGNAFAFPDLKLVSMDSRSTALAEEQFIDGNTYSDINAQTQSLSAGDYSAIVLDENQDPLIFYSAIDDNVDKNGLKVAQKINQQWQTLWLDEQCQVAGISAVSGSNGYVGVAYYTTACADENYFPRLKYAYYHDGKWQTTVLPTRHFSGAFPALALNTANQPVIVSQEIATHSGLALKNLLLSEFDGKQWQFENPLSQLEAGQYNQLWLDDDGHANIVTYLPKAKEIVLLSK